MGPITIALTSLLPGRGSSAYRTLSICPALTPADVASQHRPGSYTYRARCLLSVRALRALKV
jgi:hypothetical protein